MRAKHLLFTLLVPAFLHAENWPAWRGPTGDGTSAERDLPLTWSATEGVRWKVSLPEPGNSSPVVWGQRVFLTQPVGARRTLMCLDRADGRVLWQKGAEVGGKERTHGTNPFCSASPVTDGERVIAWFGSAGLRCWDFEGVEKWRLDLGKQDHEWGYGASPLIFGDLCILNFGPGPRSFIVAVEKRTGNEVWRFEVPAAATVEGPGAQQGYTGSWGTGVVAKIGGREELLFSLPGAVWSLDPRTGKPLWHCDGLNPVAYADPIVAGDTVMGFGGFGGFSIGVKAGGSGDITASHRLWAERKNPQRIGSGVASGAHAWIIGEPGVVQCIEAASGRVLWQQRLDVPGGRASSWSSLVLCGDRIYAMTQGADVVVFRASPEKYEPLAVNRLADGLTNSSPAVSEGQLFLRTHRSLWCIGK